MSATFAPHLIPEKAAAVARLHLGCGKDPKPHSEGWVNLDQCDLPGVDVIANLDDCAKTRLPFADDTFDEIFASHVLEHVVNTLPMMQELHRVSKPGAIAMFVTPYGSSDDAWENPTHVREYFIGSYGYFGMPFWWREDYGYRADWRNDKILLKVRKGMYTQMTNPKIILDDIMTKRNIVVEMCATLTCIKPIRAMDKALQVAPKLEFMLVN